MKRPLVEIKPFFMERKRWRYTEIHCLHFKWSFYDHLLILISTRACHQKNLDLHKKCIQTYNSVLKKKNQDKNFFFQISILTTTPS